MKLNMARTAKLFGGFSITVNEKNEFDCMVITLLYCMKKMSDSLYFAVRVLGE